MDPSFLLPRPFKKIEARKKEIGREREGGAWGMGHGAWGISPSLPLTASDDGLSFDAAVCLSVANKIGWRGVAEACCDCGGRRREHETSNP